MIRRQKLKRLYRTFDARIVRLEALIGGMQVSDPDADLKTSYAVIESLNGWASFAREYYISCTVFGATTINRAASGPSTLFADERSALAAAIGFLKPHLVRRIVVGRPIDSRDEPTWHDPNTLIRLASILSFSNQGSVTTAFSYPTTFFRDAPPIRNFFAHRNKASAAKVARLAAAPPYSSRETVAYRFLNSPIPGRSQTLLLEWIDDLRLVSREICE